MTHSKLHLRNTFRNRNVFSALVLLLMLFTKANAQTFKERYCGLWVDSVTGVIDSSANKIYFTLKPNTPLNLKATFNWDKTLYSTVYLDNNILSETKNNFSIESWQAVD